jgi:hypothetical protein
MAAKKKVEKVPAREAARVVLLEAGRPMHYREISKQAIEQGIIRVRGGRGKPDPDKTMKTIRSFLAGSAAEGKEFVRVDSGVFDLKDRPKAKAAAAKVAAKAKKAEAAKETA